MGEVLLIFEGKRGCEDRGDVKEPVASRRMATNGKRCEAEEFLLRYEEHQSQLIANGGHCSCV